MRHRGALPATIIALSGLAVAAAAGPAEARIPQPDPGNPTAAADQRIVGSGPGADVHRSDQDVLTRKSVIEGTRGTRYVTYERTHKGLPVVGGDVVVTTDAAGTVLDTAVAQDTTLNVDPRATVSANAAAATARARFSRVSDATTPQLVVLAWGKTPALAWDITVSGTASGKPSVQRIFVDARGGAVLLSDEKVRSGTGTGYYDGPVTIDTSGSGTSYTMSDPTRPGLRCGGTDGGTYTGVDDVWGNGQSTDLETACVDALYAAQKQGDMLKNWYGRPGLTSDGTFFPIRVGLKDVNAYWYPSAQYAIFGYTSDKARQNTAIDVISHEFGHAVFQFTPGGEGSGLENGSVNEGTADIMGALTEAYASNPFDPPDYEVGEEIDILGTGPLRSMYKPSLRDNAPDCYTSPFNTSDVHLAAGPLNHWFYLLAEGTNPTNGQPVSPTCNGTTLTGLGIRAAGEIYYNALLAKTSSWKYTSVRKATLSAAKSLYPNDCSVLTKVRDAWNAVNVPAQATEATCGDTPKPTCVASNSTQVPIPDKGQASSTITVSNCTKATTPAVLVEVHIRHTYRGDLALDLIAPDGTSYPVLSADSGDSSHNIDEIFDVGVSNESTEGVWTLKIRDTYSDDVGTLDSWTLSI